MPSKQELLSQFPLNNLSLAMPVRVHTNLMRESWARLWYYCRALDSQGRGAVCVLWNEARGLLRCSSPTLWEHLRKGKEVGAFRDYKKRGQYLFVWLGSRNKVCQNLDLKDWGATAELTLDDIRLECKAIATAIVAQQVQHQSVHAAKRCLQPSERERIRVVEPWAMMREIEQQSAFRETEARAYRIPYLLHISETRFFVSKGFIPIGGSQTTIAERLNISERSVRRHLTRLGITRRQIVQAKGRYKPILKGLEHEQSECLGEKVTIPLLDHCGHGSHCHVYQVNVGRIFRYGEKVWINRCNLYDLDYPMKSERKSRVLFKRLIHKFNL